MPAPDTNRRPRTRPLVIVHRLHALETTRQLKKKWDPVLARLRRIRADLLGGIG